jgi:hypothetical protein
MHLLVPIRSTRNMNYPYSSFFMDLRLAKKQLKQALAPGPGVFVERPAAASVGGPPFLRSRQRASEADQDLSEFLPHLDAMSRAFDGQQTGKQREPGHLYQSEFFLCMAP